MYKMKMQMEINPDKPLSGKHTPCKLSFVHTSQLKLTVRTEPEFGYVVISDAVCVSYFKLNYLYQDMWRALTMV